MILYLDHLREINWTFKDRAHFRCIHFYKYEYVAAPKNIKTVLLVDIVLFPVLGNVRSADIFCGQDKNGQNVDPMYIWPAAKVHTSRKYSRGTLNDSGLKK